MLVKWLSIGIGVKRWLALLLAGIFLLAVGLAYGLLKLQSISTVNEKDWLEIGAAILFGLVIVSVALLKLSHNLLAPYRHHQYGYLIDVVYAHSKRQKGVKVVAIGGGTGLPSVLSGLKAYTSNITAVVTVADDGGSSGRLRRDLGVLPPGDLRNNIAALADDEGLMTKLFQYRFNTGDLGGHAFGNLFIVALAGVSGGVETALTEVERVLNIQGRVLPATLDDVNLVASVRPVGKAHSIRIRGESKISNIKGQMEEISLEPPDVVAYDESVHAILNADLVVIGPGSLYTSIVPNLLVHGIAEALRTTTAYKVYVCNVATQPGETGGYNVADHVLALERYIGRGVFQAVLGNNTTPTLNAGSQTHYVATVPAKNEILQRYNVMYTDLADTERPWRHDPQKLARALLRLINAEKVDSDSYADPLLHISN